MEEALKEALQDMENKYPVDPDDQFPPTEDLQSLQKPQSKAGKRWGFGGFLIQWTAMLPENIPLALVLRASARTLKKKRLLARGIMRMETSNDYV